MEWDPRIKACTKVTTATNHDAISLSFNCTGFIAQFLHQVRLSFGKEVHAIYSRQVNCSNNQELGAELAVLVLECTVIKSATLNSYPSLPPACVLQNYAGHQVAFTFNLINCYKFNFKFHYFCFKCRYWETDCHPDAETWFVSVFREQDIPLDAALWSCFLVSSAEDGMDVMILPLYKLEKKILHYLIIQTFYQYSGLLEFWRSEGKKVLWDVQVQRVPDCKHFIKKVYSSDENQKKVYALEWNGDDPIRG